MSLAYWLPGNLVAASSARTTQVCLYTNVSAWAYFGFPNYYHTPIISHTDHGTNIMALLLSYVSLFTMPPAHHPLLPFPTNPSIHSPLRPRGVDDRVSNLHVHPSFPIRSPAPIDASTSRSSGSPRTPSARDTSLSLCNACRVRTT